MNYLVIVKGNDEFVVVVALPATLTIQLNIGCILLTFPFIPKLGVEFKMAQPRKLLFKHFWWHLCLLILLENSARTAKQGSGVSFCR